MKVSIITACFNSGATISETLKSVYSQNYLDIEHIIVDGQSSDNTIDLIESFKFSDRQIISEKDTGIYNAFNKGLKLATGDIIGFLNSDDIYVSSNVICSIVEEFKSNRSIECLYGDLQYVNRAAPDKVVRSWRSKNFKHSSLKFGWVPPHPTVYFHRDVYERIGNFNEKYQISADYDLLLRYFKTASINATSNIGLMVKMKSGGASGNQPLTLVNKTIEDYKIIREHQLCGILTLTSKKLRKFNQFLTYKIW